MDTAKIKARRTRIVGAPCRSCTPDGVQRYGTPTKRPTRYYVVVWGDKQYISPNDVNKYRSCGAIIHEEK